MAIKINGTNTTAQPSITGTDTDTGLVYGTDEVQVVTGGNTRVTVDSSGNITATGNATLSGGTATVSGLEGTSANLYLIADQGDDNGDGWRMVSNQDDNDLTFANNITGSYGNKLTLLNNGNVIFTGNISITTSDITNNATRSQGQNGYHFGNNSVHVLSKNAGNSSTVLDVYGSNGQFRVLGDGDLQNTNNRLSSISDLKLKENIVDANSQWDDIKAIQVRNYNFKASTGYGTHTQIGVVAQELETVCPGLIKDCIDEDADSNDLGTTTKSVAYSILYMKAIKALQEAQTRIETLETQNASQAATIAAIEARLTALEGGAE